MTTNPYAYPSFQHLNAIIYRDGNLILSKISPLRKIFMEEYHSNRTWGHSRVTKRLNRLHSNVFWEGMKKDVSDFVLIEQSLNKLNT